MTDSSRTLMQENPRPNLEGRTLSNWSLSSLLLLGAILAVTGLALWKLGPMTALICASLLLILYRGSKFYGRLYQDIGKEFASTWRNEVHKGIWWRANDTEGTKFARWLRRRRPALPAQFVRIQAEIEGKVKRFCILHQTDRPYDHLYITARGGAFSAADVNDQTRLVSEMNAILDQIISQSGLKAGISHLRITGPYNQMTVARRMRKGMDPVVGRPELFELDQATTDWSDWARKNAESIPGTLRRYRGAEMKAFIVITIKRRRKWNNLSNRQIAETPIIELGQALIEGLEEADNLMLQDIHSPDLAESGLNARMAWDKVDIAEYYKKRESGEIPKSDEEIDAILAKYAAEAEAKAASERSKRKREAIIRQGAIDGAREVDRRLQAWPQECIETNGKEHYLKFDKTYIAILRVTQLPKQFRSDQIMSLHWRVKKTWTSFALVGESISGDSQSTMLVYQASAMENYNRAFYGRRVVNDPRRSRKSREVREQLEQMSVNTIAQMANGFITVFESDEHRLRAAVKSVKARYGKIGFKTEQVKGSARLIDYFFSAALAANRA